MRSKMFPVVSMILLLLVSLTLVSAGTFIISQDLPSTVDADTTYPVKVVYNNTNYAYDEVNLTLSGDGFNPVVADFTILNDTAATINLALDVPSNAFNSFSETLTATITNGGATLEVLQVDFDADVSEQSFCELKGMSDMGDLEITSFEINNDGIGDDDEWELLDNIEIEVAIENTDNDDDVDDVVVEIMIVDDNGNDVTDDFDLDDEEIDLGDIRDGDEETATFVIEQVPVDLDEGDYRIYIVAYSDDDSSQCVSEGSDFDDYGSSESYADFEINKQNDRGIIMDTSVTRFQVTCGQQDVQIPLELYNIGSDDEESVLVNIYNSRLNIDEFEVIDNFRDGKRHEVLFNFDLPNNIDQAFYDFDVVTYWDWDDDEDEFDVNAYDENSDDDLDYVYEIRLDVVGECGSSSGNGNGNGGSNSNAPIISAELMSESVVVGDEVVIRSTVTNPHNERMDFAVSVLGYQSWAELVSVQPSIVSLDSGESVDVTIRFRPTTSGVQTFTIALQNGDAEFTQDVSLNVEDDGGFSFGSYDQDAVMYWIAVVLVVLIVFLIVLIIIVAVRR